MHQFRGATGVYAGAIIIVAGILAGTAGAQPDPANPPSGRLPSAHGTVVRQEFDARFTQHLACWQSWLRSTASLDAGQQTALAKLLQERVAETSEQHWLASSKSARSNLVNHFPVMFVERKAPLNQLTQLATIQNLLSESQNLKLQAAVAERKEFHFAAHRDYALSILDSQLFLSPAQWEGVAADQDYLRTILEEPYFAAYPSASKYLPYQSVARIVSPRALPLLTQEQRKWLTRLDAIAAQLPPRLSFRSDETREVWDIRLKEHIQSRREDVLLKLHLQTHELAREKLITPQDAESLRTAAKGVAIGLSGEIENSLRASLEQFETRVRLNPRPDNPSALDLFDRNLEVEHPETHPLWTAAYGQLLSDPVVRNLETNRQDRHRLARDRAVLAMLDRELWLRPEHRDPLLPPLSAALPPVDAVTPDNEPLRDVIWLAHAFCLAHAGKLQEALDPTQREAWKHMQACAPILHEVGQPVTIGIWMRSRRQILVPLMTHDGRSWEPERDGNPPGAPPEAMQNFREGFGG